MSLLKLNHMGDIFEKYTNTINNTISSKNKIIEKLGGSDFEKKLRGKELFKVSLSKEDIQKAITKYLSTFREGAAEDPWTRLYTVARPKAEPIQSRKSLPRSISIVMVYKYLLALLDYEPKQAGLLFESFIAGIIGGSAVINDDDGSVDVTVGDKFYSIKFIQMSTYIKTSIANFKKHIENPDDESDTSKGENFTFIVAIKEGDGVKFCFRPALAFQELATDENNTNTTATQYVVKASDFINLNIISTPDEDGIVMGKRVFKKFPDIIMTQNVIKGYLKVVDETIIDYIKKVENQLMELEDAVKSMFIEAKTSKADEHADRAQEIAQSLGRAQEGRTGLSVLGAYGQHKETRAGIKETKGIQ